MRANYLFTSESVSEGHPDKVSDQISDAIVDLFLSKDPEARIACETLTTTQLVVLAGEIRGKGIMDDGRQLGAGREGRGRKGRPRYRKAHRLRTGRLPLGNAAVRKQPAPAIGAHRAGRRRRRQQGRRRRRPRHHVRLRRQRHPRPDAGDARLQPQDPGADGGRSPLGRGAVPRARHQEPGHAALRRQQGCRLHRGRRLDPAWQGL